jgi:hypothetical protein
VLVELERRLGNHGCERGLADLKRIAEQIVPVQLIRSNANRNTLAS